MPNFQHRVLFFRTYPQMTVVHQELGSVFLRRDRIIVDILKNLDGCDVEFNSERRACVFFYAAGDDDRAFLAQRISEIVQRLVIRLKNNALNDARTVAELQKHKLAARTLVIKPALNGYGLANVIL